MAQIKNNRPFFFCTKWRKSFLALSIFLLGNFSAVSASEDDPEIRITKILKIQRDKFKDILAFRLFALPAENNSAFPLRNKIKDKALADGLSVSEEEFEQEWQKYYQANFKSPEIYQRTLTINYLNEEFLKAKFKDNLLLEKYFNSMVAVKIKGELIKEEELFEQAKSIGLKATEEERIIALESLMDDLGGEKSLQAFRTLYGLSQEEIVGEIDRKIILSKFNKNI